MPSHNFPGRGRFPSPPFYLHCFFDSLIKTRVWGFNLLGKGLNFEARICNENSNSSHFFLFRCTSLNILIDMQGFAPELSIRSLGVRNWDNYIQVNYGSS